MLRYWPTTDPREKTKCTSRALRGGHYKDLTETPKSHFYCSSVWHFCGARDADKLKALNKRILRFILGNYSSPYTTLLSKVNSTSLCNKRVQNFLILLYKSLFFTHFPAYMKNMFSLRSSSYDLRGNYILSLSKPKTTTYGLNSFSYFSAKQWTALPDFFRTSF